MNLSDDCQVAVMPRKRLALWFTVLSLQCAFSGIIGLLPAVAFAWLAVGVARR